MKKLLLLTSAAALAAGMAAPALAQTSATGTVDVTGSVAAMCSSTGFSDTITLGELSNSTTGALNPALPNNTGLTKSFTVVCTSATPTVTVSATRLQNGTAGATAGYTDVVDYTATAVVDLSVGGPTSVPYTTASPLPAANAVMMGARLANTGSSNLQVTLSNAHTTVPTAVLTAGSYSAVITVVVSPT